MRRWLPSCNCFPTPRLTAAELQAYAARQLTSYKRPSEIVILRGAAGGIHGENPQEQTQGSRHRARRFRNEDSRRGLTGSGGCRFSKPPRRK